MTVLRDLKKARVDSSHVQYVSCDFESQDWMESLQSDSDFDRNIPSLFVWEGVTMYLDREVVISTISKISRCGKGSCIAFDHFDESNMNNILRRSSKRVGEPFKFGLDNLDQFVTDCNDRALSDGTSDGGSASPPLQVLDHLRCKELKERYIAQSNGRFVGYLSEFGGFLLMGSQ